MFDRRPTTDQARALVERLLCERLSLHGICRVVGIGMKWLLNFVVECYDTAPAHLKVQLPQCPDNVLIRHLEAEANELCSFEGKKAN